MHPTDIDQQKLLSLSSPAPFSFGQHPKFERSFRKHLKRLSFGKEISLSELADPRHPEVFIIPRNRFLYVVDEWGNAIGFEQTAFPFSSTDFYVDIDEDEKGLFYEFGHSPPLLRLGGISQLGYLVPPRPKEWNKEASISYLRPTFHHTRWIHSLLVAILTEVILARNGFSQKERMPLVLTAGCHDIATPAGGDSIKRVDPKNLDEEENFGWVLEHYDLIKRWSKRFGFDLGTAESWVRGEGVFGQLLDVIDKISYTALDCYHVGFERPCQIRDFCLKHPLAMVIWQDIRFTPDRTEFFFAQPECLFRFLLLRAYEFQEFLFNPYSRALDLFLKRLTQPLYQTGIITKKQLLTQNDNWLEQVLSQYYPEEIKWIIEPEELSWEKFKTEEDQGEFCAKLGARVDHTEYLAGPSTGLDWLVSNQEKIVPLRRAISERKVKLLEEVVASIVGYYVYYKRP